jgi:hypothetical protein
VSGPDRRSLLERAISAEDYVRRVQARAQADFAGHVIRRAGDRDWTCYHRDADGRWRSEYWFDAFVTFDGAIVVQGDIDIVCFARYGRYAFPREVLNWMGRRDAVSTYVLEKASIGMTVGPEDNSVVRTVQEDVWMHDAVQYVRQNYEVQLDATLAVPDAPEWLTELLREVSDGTDPREAVANAVGNARDCDLYEEGVYDWGVVPSGRVIYAHAAIRRLTELLDSGATAPAP